MKEYEQMGIELLQNEIDAELKSDAPIDVDGGDADSKDEEPNGAKEAESKTTGDASSRTSEARAARKPFRIRDFDPPHDKEMAVFTHAKKLSEYIFVITEKSPVKYRWSIVSRLLDTSTDIIECLYRANCEEGAARYEWQKKANVSLNLLNFYAETAKTKQAINFRQMTIIAKQICEVRAMLSGWIRSTRKSTSNA